MRLWHYKLIPALPSSQLVSQWKELNSIYEKQDKHILINYVYKYHKIALFEYSLKVITEFKRRGYKIKSFERFYNYFCDVIPKHHEPLMIVLKSDKEYFNNLTIEDWELVLSDMFSDLPVFIQHHNQEYLEECFYNLREKYSRGQADIDNITMTHLKCVLEDKDLYVINRKKRKYKLFDHSLEVQSFIDENSEYVIAERKELKNKKHKIIYKDIFGDIIVETKFFDMYEVFDALDIQDGIIEEKPTFKTKTKKIFENIKEKSRKLWKKKN